ncbi:MAG: ABC transporter substrate-binding protein [Turicibacter sp.]|nr:ABC transporter substrate-binding protein [Turicibacter sp.]
MKRTKLMALMAMLLVAVFVFAACGTAADTAPAADPAPAGGQQATTPATTDPAGDTAAGGLEGHIVFTWWGDQGRHDATNRIVELFMEENPGVTIETVYQPFTGYQEVLATDLMAGTEADLIQINFNWIELYSPMGDTFADLETLTNYLNLNNWYPADIDIVRSNGIVQAVPTGITARVPFMRSDIYGAAGLNIQDINTWDDLMEAGRIIQAELGPDFFALSPLGNASQAYLVFSWLEQYTGRQFVDANNQFNYSLEELTAGFQLIQDFIDNGVMPPGGFDSDSINSVNPLWIAGHYGGVSEWDSSINNWINNLEHGEDVIEVRDHFTMDGALLSGVMARPSMAFAISRNSQHQDIAATFLDFMLTDPRSVEIMGTDRGVPSNNVALSIFMDLVDQGLIGGAALDANNIHANAVRTTMSPVFEFPEVREVYESQLEALHFGYVTVAEAAQFVYDNIQAVIDSLVN